MFTFAKARRPLMQPKFLIEDEPRLEHNKSRIPTKDLNRIMKWLAMNRSLVERKWAEHFKD